MNDKDLKKVNGYYVNKKNVGNRIFKIRNNRNDTLEEFGKLFGASKGNVLNWESGSSLPNKSRIEKIAKKGNLTVNELLYGSIEEFARNNMDKTDITEQQFDDFLINIKDKYRLDNIDILVDRLKTNLQIYKFDLKHGESIKKEIQLDNMLKEMYGKNFLNFFYLTLRIQQQDYKHIAKYIIDNYVLDDEKENIEYIYDEIVLNLK